jgi:hypothetical protein
MTYSRSKVITDPVPDNAETYAPLSARIPSLGRNTSFHPAGRVRSSRVSPDAEPFLMVKAVMLVAYTKMPCIRLRAGPTTPALNPDVETLNARIS